MEWDVIRVTGGTSTHALAGGVSSISSAFCTDMSNPYGSVNLITINTSIETTFTQLAEVWYVGVNQRASYRWVAAPGSEIVWPANASAVASNGVSARVRSGAYTGTATMTLMFSE
jgi:hypothetical protein